jgi:transcriptional/translational regulatory protein YebC/TACO1
VECATDNTTRTVANVKSYFNKAGGAWCLPVRSNLCFQEKQFSNLRRKREWIWMNSNLPLIDAGLEEIEENDGIFYAYADYTSFGDMGHALEELKIDVQKAVLKRFPNEPVEFTEEQLEDIEKMLDKLEDDDDVQAVYTNIA